MSDTLPNEVREAMARLTKQQRDIMSSYTPQTYAINFPRDRVKGLVDMGLLEWLPPVWGNAHNWGATPLGREVAALLTASNPKEKPDG